MARILVSGITHIDPLGFLPPSNTRSYMNKPGGCLWGSTMTKNDEFLSDWLEWVYIEDFYIGKYKKGISFTLKKKSKICTISSEDDYKNLMRKYDKYKYDNDEVLMKSFKIKVIDWEKLCLDYDAFHITREAICRMRLPLNGITDEDGIELDNFYSYDCESWILFNLDCINQGSILNHCTYKPHYDFD